MYHWINKFIINVLLFVVGEQRLDKVVIGFICVLLHKDVCQGYRSNECLQRSKVVSVYGGGFTIFESGVRRREPRWEARKGSK